MDLHELGAGAYPEFITHTDESLLAKKLSDPRRSEFPPGNANLPIRRCDPSAATGAKQAANREIGGPGAINFSIQTIRSLSLSIRVRVQQAIWGRHKDSIKDVLVALGHFALPSTSERERSSGKRLIAASAGHGIALVCVAAALSFSLPLQSIFPYPFLFLFFAAVMASAWFGGTAPGLFAVLLSTLAVDYFFVPPFHSFAVNATDSAYFVALFYALWRRVG